MELELEMEMELYNYCGEHQTGHMVTGASPIVFRQIC